MLKLIMHHHSAKELAQSQRPSDNIVAFLIEEESSLTQNEVESARVQGFNLIVLGPRVLRTKIAPMVVLSTRST